VSLTYGDRTGEATATIIGDNHRRMSPKHSGCVAENHGHLRFRPAGPEFRRGAADTVLFLRSVHRPSRLTTDLVWLAHPSEAPP